MAVQYGNIIQKMITELQHAKSEQNNLEKMKRHIAKVHVLSELVLDEKSKTATNANDKITDQEMVAMLGKGQLMTSNQKQNKPVIDANPENAESIFDF